jgi:hypothetical protein
MVGGGPGAFIGEVHRKASRMDGGIELVAAAFDINPRKSKQQGREVLLPAKRVYGNYKEMIKKVLKLSEGERIDFVSASMPDNWHYPLATGVLEAGCHGMRKNPMLLKVREASQKGQNHRPHASRGGFLQSDFMLVMAVLVILLLVCTALVVYFSDPGSQHREELQRTIIEALMMACMFGVGTIFGIVSSLPFRKERTHRTASGG